jgi:hypothetical protein
MPNCLIFATALSIVMSSSRLHSSRTSRSSSASVVAIVHSRAASGSVALGLTLVRNQSNTVVGRGSGLGAMMRAVCLAAALCVVAADIITNCIDNNTLS